jgi:hypothetical protein
VGNNRKTMRKLNFKSSYHILLVSPNGFVNEWFIIKNREENLRVRFILFT